MQQAVQPQSSGEQQRERASNDIEIKLLAEFRLHPPEKQIEIASAINEIARNK